jgi:hypothetical protein
MRRLAISSSSIAHGLIGAVEDLGLPAHALKVSALCPVHYSYEWHLFGPRSSRRYHARAEGAVAMHQWNSALADNDIQLLNPPNNA